MEFFNGLGRKFTNAARSVQELTRDTVEGSRISADIRAAKGELDRHYAELGRAYYASLGGKTEVPGELIRAVRISLERIDELTVQQDRLRQQVRCPGCGAAQAEDAKFCSNCGRPMPEPAPEIPEPTADAEYCVRCGAMRHEDARFCDVCGEAFDPAERIGELPAPATLHPSGEGPEEPNPEHCAE